MTDIQSRQGVHPKSVGFSRMLLMDFIDAVIGISAIFLVIVVVRVVFGIEFLREVEAQVSPWVVAVGITIYAFTALATFGRTAGMAVLSIAFERPLKKPKHFLNILIWSIGVTIFVHGLGLLNMINAPRIRDRTAREHIAGLKLVDLR